LSLVLRGGYLEERRGRDDPATTRRWLPPGRLNLLLPGVFHRVELRDGRAAWTLFVHGRKVRRWGFLDAVTGAFRLWSPAKATRGGPPPSSEGSAPSRRARRWS
jgi:hypothetical protein